jgi:hypothetical protein
MAKIIFISFPFVTLKEYFILCKKLKFFVEIEISSKRSLIEMKKINSEKIRNIRE